MKKLFVAVFAFSALYMNSCKSGGGGDPKAVLISFFDAMAKKDIATARKLATKDSQGMFDFIEAGMKMAENITDDQTKEQFDRNKVEFGEAKIDGDRATVNVKETKGGKSVDIVLKKEGGSWKVAMDAATMMNMAGEKMKEGDMDADDMEKMKEGMEKLKNINADSINKLMEKGMKTLDSINKILNKK